MSPRFLGKTGLVDVERLRSSHGQVVGAYEVLRAALIRVLGGEGAELLAEPIVTEASNGGEGSISWYTEALGEPVLLHTVTADRRLVLEARLRRLLAGTQELLNERDLSDTLRAALCVLSPASIWAVGDQVVLTEWGLAPANRDKSGPPPLRQSAIGGYLPPIGAREAARPAAVALATAAPVSQMPAPFVRPVAQSGLASPPRRMLWWPVAAAVAIAAVFLALGYWRGSILAADRAGARPNTVSVLDENAVRDATERQLAQNAALMRQIEDRRRLLAGNVCLIDPATMPRVGPDRAAAPPPAVVPPPPGGQPFRGNLADLLKQALVMVVVPTGGDALSLGSGFYVTPELIATNRHVIENAREGKVGVINEKLGKLVRGEVTASSPTSDVGALDIALIRVPANPNVQPLTMTTTVAELDPVIAAGYPALVLRGDTATRRLLVDGDLTAAPTLVLTDGRINAIQTSAQGFKVMPHSASISGGSSGGPLVDACGRVVGVNTYIASDREQTAHVNYAQKSEAIIAFMKENGAQIAELAGPCPVAPAAAAPVPPVPAPAAQPPGAPAQR